MGRFTKSVVHAVGGLRYAVGAEKNFRLEVVAAVAVGVLAFLIPLPRDEQMILVFVIVGVLVLELINTAVERVVDMLKPRVHPYARIAKDVMAGAVFVSSLGAVVIGLMLFSPHLMRLLK